MTLIPSGVESNEEYHASGAWGSTTINMFIKSWEKAWLMLNKQLPFEKTNAMTIGSALHARFDDTFNDEYAVGPNVSSRRTKTWTEAVATDPEKTWLLPSETWLIDQMESSICNNDTAADLLIGADHEVGIRQVCPYGDFKIQCRMDIYKPGSHIVDLKTTFDLGEFEKSMTKYGYHRQAALYMWLCFLETGVWLPFLFIVVEKNAPHRTRVIQLDDDYLTIGFADIKAALEQIADCYRNGSFKDPECQLLKPPSWLKPLKQESIDVSE